MTTQRSSRRSILFVSMCVAASGLVYSKAPVAAQENSPQEERPNVLLIVTDDQRDDDASRAVLPVLDRFPLRFSRAYTTTPLCCPARASIFSGKYVHNHGITKNQGKGFDAGDSMQSILGGAGYKTAIVGKYLNGVFEAPHFDRAHILRPDKRYYGSTFYVDGVPRKVSGYMTTYIRETALSIVRDFSAGKSPWFVYVSPYAPHRPSTPEAKYQTASVPTFPVPDDDLRGKPGFVKAKQKSAEMIDAIRTRQLRSLMSVDDLVAALLDELDRLGETNTLVVFTSDNGYMWGEHGLISKRFPYEPSVRVPMFVKWDGHITAGTSTNLVANIDIAPTVFEAADVEPGYVVDGRSMFADARSHLLLEFWNDGHIVPGWTAIVTADHAFIRSVKGYEELYNLTTDPNQLDNLADSRLERGAIRELRAASYADRTCTGSTCP